MNNTKDERPLRQRGLASVFDVFKAKRDANGKRIFFENGDRETMVYLANKRGEHRVKKDNEQKLHEQVKSKG